MCFEVANCFQALDLREGEGLRGELNTGRGGGVGVGVGVPRWDCEAKGSLCAGLAGLAPFITLPRQRWRSLSVAPRLSFGDKHLKKRVEGKGGGSWGGFAYGCTDPSTHTGTWLRTQNH